MHLEPKIDVSHVFDRPPQIKTGAFENHSCEVRTQNLWRGIQTTGETPLSVPSTYTANKGLI